MNWPAPSQLDSLSPHQRSTLTTALRGPVSILAGTPGTGKTYTAAALIRSIRDTPGVGSHNIAVAAPTGKAAVRCTDTLQSYGIHDIEATTMHRLLGVSRNGYDGQGWGFVHNRANPLPHRYIVMDESSMLSTDDAAAFFDACHPGTHVLLVGDPYQLPPVGHGAPLRDFIKAGLPYGELTEIKRNAGRGVQVCRDLKEGKPYRPSPDVALYLGENVKHIETQRAAHSIAALTRMLNTASFGDLDPAWDIQVLCTVNEKSELSRASLNKHLQSLLNPHGERVEGNAYRLGDKVICTSNTMLPLLNADGETETDLDDEGESREVKEFVANGEIGKVVHVAPKLMHVEFFAPARTVKVPLGKARKDENGEHAGNGGDFTLAYAITVHKSQGSQWPVTITMIDDYPGAARVACRELYYTGLSRFETMSVTIGRAATLNKHCRRVSLRERKTFLVERLKEEGVAAGAATR